MAIVKESYFIRNEPEISDLIGETFSSVRTVEGDYGFDELHFLREDGTGFAFYHSQNCCESVTIEDVIGDLSDLEGTPILHASEDTSGDNPPGIEKEYQDDSFTWTFYTFRTIKGTVTVRWYGESNGYYSESVDLSRLVEESPQ